MEEPIRLDFESPTSWGYIEQCEGEFKALIQQRSSKSISDAISHATLGEYHKAESSLHAYVKRNPQDYLGFLLLGQIQELYTLNNEKASSINLTTAQMLSTKNFNANHSIGLALAKRQSYRSALVYLLNAEENWKPNHSEENPEIQLNTIMQLDLQALESSQFMIVDDDNISSEMQPDIEMISRKIEAILVSGNNNKNKKRITHQFIGLLWRIAEILIKISENQLANKLITYCLRSFPESDIFLRFNQELPFSFEFSIIFNEFHMETAASDLQLKCAQLFLSSHQLFLVQYNVANALYGLQLYEQALKFALKNEQHEFKESFNLSDTQYLIGRIYFALKEYKNSYEYLEAASSHSYEGVNHKVYWLGKVSVLIDENRKEAENLLLQTLQMIPNHDATLFELGKLKFSQGNTAEAIKYLKRCIYLKTTEESAYELLSNLYGDSKMYTEQAEVLTEQFNRFIDSGETVSKKLGDCYRYGLSNNEESTRWYSTALEYNPDSIEVNFEMAQCLKEAHDLEYSLLYFTKVQSICDSKKSNECLFQIAIMYVEHQLYEDAKPYLQKSLAIDSEHPSILNSFAEYYMFHEKNLSEAIKLLERSRLQTCEDTVRVRTQLLLGIAYKKQKKMHEAKQCFEDVLLKDPLNYAARLELAFIYFFENSFKKAFYEFELVPTLFGKNAQAMYFFCLGQCELSTGDPEKSFGYFESSVMSGNSKYLTESLELYFETIPLRIDYDELIRSLESMDKIRKVVSAEKKTHYVDLNKYLGLAYFYKGNSLKKAKECFERSVDKSDANLKTKLLQCLVELSMSNDVKEVVEGQLSKLLLHSHRTLFKEYKLLMFHFYFITEQYTEAMQMAEQLLLYPLGPRQNMDLHYKIGEILMKTEKESEALDVLRKNINHAPSLWQIGVFHSKEKGYTYNASVDFFTKAESCDPTFVPNLLSLAELEKKQGKVLNATVAYDQAISHMENCEFRIVETLFAMYMESCDYEKAEDLMEKIRGKPNIPSFKITVLLGRVQFAKKKYAEAIVQFDIILKEQPNDASVMFQKSQCENALKLWEEEFVTLEKCVELDPVALHLSSFVSCHIALKKSNEEVNAIFTRFVDAKPDKFYPAFQDAIPCLMDINLQRTQEILEELLEKKKNNSDIAFALLNICLTKKNATDLKKVKQKTLRGLEEDLQKYFEFAEACYHSNFGIELSEIEKNYFAIKELEWQLRSKKLERILILCWMRITQIQFVEKRYLEARGSHLEINKAIRNYKLDQETKNTIAFLSAQLMIQQEKYEEAHIALSKQIKFVLKTAQETTWYACLSYCLQAQGSNRARRAFKRVTDLPSATNDISDYQLLVEAMFMIEDAELAVSPEKKATYIDRAFLTLLEAQMSFEKSVQCSILLGDCNYFKANYDQAMKIYQECLKQEPTQRLDTWMSKPFSKSDKYHCMYRICEIMSLQKNYDDLATPIEKLITEYPDQVKSQIIYVEYLYVKQDWMTLRQHAKIVIQKDSAASSLRMNFLIGKSHEAEKSYNQAMRAYITCRTIDPAFPGIQKLIGSMQMKFGQAQEAILTYLPIISYQPEHQGALVDCATLLASIEKFTEALTLIERYSKVNSDISAELLLLQAHIFERMNSAEKSVEILFQGIQKFPANTDILISLARILHEKSEYEQEIIIFLDFLKKLQESQEVNVDITAVSKIEKGVMGQLYNSLANAYAAEGNLSDAIDMYKKASSCDSSNLRIEMNVGICQFALGQFAAALQTFSGILDKHSFELDIMYLKGITLAKLSRLDEAIEALRECIKYHYSYSPAAINLSIIYRNMNLPMNSIQTLTPLTRYYPRDLKLFYHLSISHFQARQYSAAQSILEKLVVEYDNYAVSNEIKEQTDPVNVIFPKKVGNTKNDSYIESYQLSGLRIPSKEMIVMLLARIHRIQGNYKEEQKLLQELQLEDVLNVKAIFAYFVSMTISNPKLSYMHKFEECMELDPSRKCLYLLAISNVVSQEGDIEEEIKILKECILLNPEFYQVYDNIGVAFSKVYEYQQAIDAFKRSIELEPKKFSSHFNLGNVYTRARKFEFAIASYNSALQLKPNALDALYNLGIAYMLNRQNIASIECFDKCIQFDPDNIQKYQERLVKIHKQQIMLSVS